LTKEQAIKAIGEMKHKFIVVSVEKGAKKAKKPSKKKEGAAKKQKKNDSK
jgi:hypothetical protein